METNNATNSDKTVFGHNQNLFNALKNVCGFIALQSEMDEIKRAIEKDCIVISESNANEPVTDDELNPPEFPFESGQFPIIFKHFNTIFSGLEKASVEYFLQTGKINGSFKQHIKNCMNEWAELYHQHKLSEALEKAGKELPDVDSMIPSSVLDTKYFGATWMKEKASLLLAEREREIERLRKFIEDEELEDIKLLDFIDWFGTWQTDKRLDDYGINDILDAYRTRKEKPKSNRK